MKCHAFGVVFALFSAGSAFAAPVTIDFNGGDGPLPYVENGFEVSGDQPTHFVTDTVLNPNNFDVGSELNFVRQSGETFRFTSFELYRHNSLHSTFTLRGFLDDVEVADYGEFALGGGELFEEIFIGSMVDIDELRMIGTGLRGGGLALDNFVFDIDRDPPVVPLPASAFLLVGALGGLTALQRRRRTD